MWRVFAACSCFVLACVPAGDRVESAVTRDSAGITIVENIEPAWTASNTWSVNDEPVKLIGGDPTDTTQHFLRLLPVRSLESGGIAAINRGSNSIIVLDSLGRFKHAVGRSGQGPGEYSRLVDLYVCDGDTLVANDFARMIKYAPDGTPVSTEPLRASSTERVLRVWGVAPDCTTYLFASRPIPVATTAPVYRPPVTLHWGHLDSSAHDSIGTFLTNAVVTRMISGMGQALMVPWGPELVWALSGNRLYIASSDQPEIRVFEHNRGLVRIIRWSSDAESVTAADRDLYEQKRLQWLEIYPQIAEVIPLIDEYPALPQSKPYFRSILIDDHDNLWVRNYPVHVAGRPDRYDFQMGLWETPAQSSSEKWMVFDPSGRLLGSVEVPAAIDVRAIRNDEIIGVWKNELDVEHIAWYAIARSSN
jgi:hypothetical protein